jgi:radical SAM protein with 4Fe4S-binding SPASM domain
MHYKNPYIAVWETTFQCIMKCRHCGSSCDTNNRPDELSTPEALDLCDQIAELKTHRVVLSGGETFMRPDWPIIADRLVGNGVEVSVITNGLVITPAVISNLVLLREKYPRDPIALHLSVDGVGESHDYLRGVEGAFQKLVKIMKVLNNHETPFSVVTTIHRRNVHQLPEILDLVRKEGAYAWQMQIVNGYGRARNNGLSISPDDYYNVVNCIAGLVESNRDFRIEPSDCIGYYGANEKVLRKTPWSGCHAGIYCYGIQSNGNVKGCLSLIDDRFIEGNIRKEKLREIWEKPGAFAYNREFTPAYLTGHCRDCEYGAVCRGGCTAIAHSYTGSCFENTYCTKAIEAKRA